MVSHAVDNTLREVLGGALLALDAGTLLALLWQYLLIGLVGLLIAVVAFLAFVAISLFVAFVRDPLAGFIAAICRLITWPLAAIARGALRARIGLRGPTQRAFTGLRYGPSERTDEEPSAWVGWTVLGPLVYLTFLLLLGAGDFYLMVLRLQALLYGGNASGLSLPIPLDLLSGVLWVVMVATFASVLFDLYGATPIARPFHNIGAGLRRVLRIMVWVALVLSFAAALFWLWGQLRIDLTQGNPDQYNGYEWVFTVVFAVLLNVAVFLAGWAVPAAAAALYALLLGALRLLLWLVYGLLELLVRLVNGVARVIIALIDVPARVGRVVYNWATKFDWARNRFLFELAPFEVPDLPSIEVDDLLDTANADSSARMKVPPMPIGHPVQDTVIAGLGDAGERLLLDLVAGEAPRLGPATVLAVGAVNDTLTPGEAQTTRLRVRNVSPQRRELRLATDSKASPGRARLQLISDMVDRLIKVQSLARLARGQMLVLAELAALDEPSAHVLGDVDRRVQGESVILYCLLPHRGQRDTGLGAAFGQVLRLRDESALAAAILVDPSGPFATSYGEQLLTQFVVVGLAGLFGAAAYGHENRPAAQVMAALGQRAGLVGLAFAGRRLIPLNGAQPSGAARSGQAFPEYRLTEMVAKAIEATEAALAEPSACAVESTAWGERDVALIYTVPLHAQDPRWDEFAESVRSQVAKRGLASSLLFVPGLGTATDGVIGRDYGVQVTALYPLPRVPKPLRPYVTLPDAESEPAGNASRPDSRNDSRPESGHGSSGTNPMPAAVPAREGSSARNRAAGSSGINGANGSSSSNGAKPA